MCTSPPPYVLHGPPISFFVIWSPQYLVRSTDHKVTAVAQWFRCCATNRKVAGSIPAGVSGFFIDKILPIALILLQKWIPGVFPGGKGGRCVRLTTYHHPVPLARNLGTLTSRNPLGLSRPLMGLLYLLPFVILHDVWKKKGWGVVFWFLYSECQIKIWRKYSVVLICSYCHWPIQLNQSAHKQYPSLFTYNFTKQSILKRPS